MLTLTNQVNICSFSATDAATFYLRKLDIFDIYVAKVFHLKPNAIISICFIFLNASRLVLLPQKRMEYQLEKSISSHDQGETPKASHKNSRRRRRRRHDRQKKKRQLGNHTRRQAHDFNPFESDYVDFGAVIGQNGAFSWHANYSPD